MYRNNCLEMSWAELDLVILTAYMCLRPHSGESGEIARTRTVYLHQGLHTCMKTFLFLHSISHSHLNHLQAHYNTYGVTPRVYGNTHHAPKHTASMEDTNRAVIFVPNMVAVHALPLPGQNHTNKDEQYLLLPSDMTKAFVYWKYRNACDKEGVSPFQRRKFESV